MLLPGVEQMSLTEPLAHLREHGYARLGRVLNDEGLELLRARADDLMLGRVTYPGFFFQMDATTGRYEDAPIGQGWQGPSLNYRKLEKLEKDPLFAAWLQNPLFERVVRAQIDGDVVLYRSIIFNKGEHGGSDIPYHQDGGKLWGLSHEPFVQIWTALDDAPLDGGCLEVVPGSQRGGLASPLGGVVPKAMAAAVTTNVPVPVKAGEAVLIHNHVWHRSGRSETGQRRRGFSACYMSVETKCVRKKGTPRVFFPVFRSTQST